MTYLQVLQSWTQVVYNLFGILGFFALFVYIFTYVVYRKQLSLATMARCIDRFRKDFIYLGEEKDPDIRKVFEYLDFVNEELFYFENGYVPYFAMLEWIDGMIDMMPIIQNRKVVNMDHCIKSIVEKALLAKFKRILIAFSLRGVYDFKNIYEKRIQSERTRLAEEILKNLGVSKPFLRI